MARVTSLFQLTMKFSGDQQGVSETLYLPDATRADAMTNAQDILRWRSLFGGSRDAKVAADAFPIAGGWPGSTFSTPSADELAPNLISDALTIRSETADGLWNNRWIHGIPDKAIHIGVLTATYLAIVTDPTDTPATNLSFIAAVASYLSVLKQRTVFLQKRGAGDSRTLDTFALDKVLPVQVISKKVGKPFRQQRGRATPR